MADRTSSKFQPLAAADAVVRDAKARQVRWIIQIATVENDWRLEPRLDVVEVGTAKFLPLGDYRERICAGERRLGILDQGEILALAKRAPRLVHRHRIVGLNLRAVLPELFHQRAARRLTHVVGVGLERQAPQGERPTGELAIEVAMNFFEQDLLLA